MHVLRDCIRAQRIWAEILILITMINFFHNPLNKWLKENANYKEPFSSQICPVLGNLFSSTLYGIYGSLKIILFSK